jgi:SpoVK/Ycf46/Vps4 family AAA+-type ATPase
MDDCDWYAAASKEDAIAAYIEQVGEFDDSDMYQLSDEQLDRLEYTDADENENPTGEKRTFREQLAREVAAGTQFPCLFASTEY